jgi:hypothetical protein
VLGILRNWTQIGPLEKKVMCAMYHDKKAAMAAISTMNEGIFKDGLLLDCPKRRRREQAQNKRPFLIKMAPEHKLRLGKQMNRFIEIFGKDLGIEMMLKLMEHPSDERLRELVEERE